MFLIDKLPTKLRIRLQGFECELCHFKSRSLRKVDSHVMLFPRCYWDAVDKQQNFTKVDS